MNYAKVFFLGLVIIFSLSAQSEHKKHALQANISTFAVGNYELSYEHRLDKHLSLSTLAYYYDSRKVLFRIYSLGYSFGLGFAPKFHVWGHALENSFYLAPTVKAGYLVHVPTNLEKGDRSILLRLGAIFGYAHVFSFGLILDTNVGLEHYHSFSISKEPTYYQNEKPLILRPTFALNLGYAF